MHRTKRRGTKTRRLKTRRSATRKIRRHRTVRNRRKMRGGVDPVLPEYVAANKAIGELDDYLAEHGSESGKRKHAEKRRIEREVEELEEEKKKVAELRVQNLKKQREEMKRKKASLLHYGFPESEHDFTGQESFIEPSLSNPERIAEQKKKKGMARFKSFLRKKFTRKNKESPPSYLSPAKINYNPIYSSSNRSN
jgi:hypothetical protein